jgi:hypothetical protein
LGFRAFGEHEKGHVSPAARFCGRSAGCRPRPP